MPLSGWPVMAPNAYDNNNNCCHFLWFHSGESGPGWHPQCHPGPFFYLYPTSFVYCSL